MNIKTFLFSSSKIGIILGIITIIYSVLLYILDVNIFNISFSIINVLLALFLISFLFFVGGKRYRNNIMKGYMNYGQAFLYCIFAGAIAGIISSLYNYVFYEFIVSPDYISNMINSYMLDLERLKVPQETLDNTYKTFQEQKNLQPYERGLYDFVSVFLGSAIVSLIVSIFIKRKKHIFDKQ